MQQNDLIAVDGNKPNEDFLPFSLQPGSGFGLPFIVAGFGETKTGNIGKYFNENYYEENFDDLFWLCHDGD